MADNASSNVATVAIVLLVLIGIGAAWLVYTGSGGDGGIQVPGEVDVEISG